MRAAEYALLLVVVVVMAYLIMTPIVDQTVVLFNEQVAVLDGAGQ